MPLILRLLPGATVFVDKREESEYAAVVPRNQLWLHESLPGLVAIRNWLNANVQEDCLVMIDDDFRGVIPLMGKHRPITDPVVIAEVIANGHRVAEDLGISVFCWGRSLNNVLLKPEWDPFRLVGPISSSFGLRGAARSRRFDPACEIREDLDFTMQTLLEDRILLMEMRWYFDHGRIFSGRGGNVGLGKKEVFDRTTALLEERWGEFVSSKSLPWLKHRPTNPPMSVRVRRKSRLTEN